MIFLAKQRLYGTKMLGPRPCQTGLEWNLEDGLTIIKGKIYVPNDPLIHSMHRSIIIITLSRQTPWTTEDIRMVQCDYWWAGVSVFVKNYMMAVYSKPQRQLCSIKPLISQSPLPPNHGRHNSDFVTESTRN